MKNKDGKNIKLSAQNDFPIDFVILWVNGNDPAWLAEKSAYSPRQDDDSATANRYRDWGLLRYWFRSVEKFAPWVKRVYFVTWGHLPAWLDTSARKLVIVNHKDFIPNEYLPVFNSNAIEIHLHRIEGLSEHFVLFNDDFYLTAPVFPTDFFDREGNPCESAVMNPCVKFNAKDSTCHAWLNNVGIINDRYEKKDVVRKQWRKFFSPRVGTKGLVRNVTMLPYKYFSSFHDAHVCAPHLKSTFEEVWEAYPETMETCAKNRFRSKDDVTQYLMKWWNFCSGRFSPRPARFGTYYNADEYLSACCAVISRKFKCVCINDTDDELDMDLDVMRQNLMDAFEILFPDKSAYELDNH